MTTTPLAAELEKIVGHGQVSASRTDRIVYSYDATQEKHLPDLIVHARTTEQISAILKVANRHAVPVIPRGAGSGFTGGTLPIHGGIVLVLTGMNRILEIDEDNLTAIVEPGVVTAEFQREVEKRGLFYPPDPASKEFSTMGGNVAECAGGPRCVKYGVTKDYILGLEVVTPTGDVIKTGGKTLKNVVGYDLTKLFIGSEGTLGIVTKIIVKLLPKPEARKTMLVQFETIGGAAQSVSAIIRRKIIPTTLEFLDSSTIDCIRDRCPLPLEPSSKALLIIEVDGDARMLDRQAEEIRETIRPFGVLATKIADTAEESEIIWQVRRSVSPSLRQVNPNKFNEDIVVPRSKVPDMVAKLEELSHRYQVPIVNFGHAGDGNIHVNVMVDLTEVGMQEKVRHIMRDIFAAAVALHGSISGEHGIGTAKADYLGLELDPVTVSYMQKIKAAFDPNNILNPGKIFRNDEIRPEVSASTTAS